MNFLEMGSEEEALQRIAIQQQWDQNLPDEDAHLLRGLEMIIASITGNFELQQDLMQECRIRLWKFECEGESSRKTISWYLQNCRFHVLHFLNAGRSLDSLKRASSTNRITISIAGDQPTLARLNANEDLFEKISARDLISTLNSHLKPRERKVLKFLADGWNLKDIATKTGLSYPTALKSRRIIAELIVKLGIAQPSRNGTPRKKKVTARKSVRSRHLKGKNNGTERNLITD